MAAPRGLCAFCNGRLVRFGDARVNGADRKDFRGRSMHLKCYKVVMRTPALKRKYFPDPPPPPSDIPEEILNMF